MLTLYAPAKINWFLEVTGKRPDGYHELVTVMQAISLYDRLDFKTRSEPGLALTCNIDLGPPEKNLVYRAGELLRARYAPDRGASVHLEKKVPHGAGLGGGSSDAAAAVVGLNKLWGLKLENRVLENLVSEVGSDCAFFVQGGVALCTGRGEIIEHKAPIPRVHLVILYPNIVLPTVDVYRDLSRHLTYQPRNCYFFHGEGARNSAKTLPRVIFNRLEESALRVSPELREVWQKTSAEAGVTCRFVSGSGSSIAFVMEDGPAAQTLARTLEDRGLGRAFAVTTVTVGVSEHQDAGDRSIRGTNQAGQRL